MVRKRLEMVEPKEKVELFNHLYMNFDHSIIEDDSEWWEYFVCAEWKETKEGYRYSFVEYPDYFE